MIVETLGALVLMAAAVGGALVLAGVAAVGGRWLPRRPGAAVPYGLAAILLASAVATLFSGRTLALSGVSTADIGSGALHPAVTWTLRGVSLLLLAIAAERLLHGLGRRIGRSATAAVLLPAFVAFWLTTVAVPALFAAHPQLSHDFVYPLFIGIAAILLPPAEGERAIVIGRNALLVFLVVSLALIPLAPQMVMDSTYNQGYIVGLPRLAGLAPHAVSLGMLAQLAMFCLWVRPLAQRSLNLAAWGIALAVLVLAQSKTAWLSTLLCFGAMALVRHGGTIRRRLGDPGRPAAGLIAALGLAAGLILAVGIAAVFGDVGARLERFFDSAEGAQLTSLTGRDRIWEISFAEWRRHPVFGYGPLLFDEAYRQSIGLLNATHAHNQFIDTLARSGLVGALGLTAYFIVLLVYSLKHARASGGLSIALFIAVAFRCVSEIPLSAFRYGPEFILHMMLLFALVGTGGAQASGAEDLAGRMRSPPGEPVGLAAEGA